MNSINESQYAGLSRRKFLGAAAATAGTVIAGGWMGRSAATAPPHPGDREEDAVLAGLYAAARAEGGALVLYEGADGKSQSDDIVARFEARFPGLHVTKLADLSKYHETRLKLQFAAGDLQADIARLQTLQDFPRWKREGKLLPYRPLGWHAVPASLKDPDSFYIATTLLSFANVVNTKLIPAAHAPRDPKDYLDPSLKGKLVFAYPTDDEACLAAWKHVIDQTGLDYVEKLMRQDPLFVRGTASTVLATLASGQRAASFAAPWPVVPSFGLAWQPPRHGDFMSWGQPAAIFKKAKHPAAAKLFLSWSLSKAEQANFFQWPVRQDVPGPGGPYGNPFKLNTDPSAFARFMADRAEIEKFRLDLEYFTGPAQGPNPALS